MATPDEILLEWRKMKAAYPASFSRSDDDEITANQFIWIEQLSDLAPDLLRAACANYRSSDAEWFPAAGKIRKMAFDLASPNHRTGAEAWGDVVKAFHRDGGQYGVPQFDDPIVAEVVKALEWRRLCNSEEQDEVSNRAKFVDAYNAIASLRRNETLTLPEVRRVQAQIQSKAQDEIKRLAEARRL